MRRILGKIPTRIIITAPVAIAKRFTTFVIATSPTFWLKEVIGRQPKIEDNELMKPSQVREPDISLIDASRSVVASTEVSSIVSVAETKKISTTARMALMFYNAVPLYSFLQKIHCDLPYLSRFLSDVSLY